MEPEEGFRSVQDEAIGDEEVELTSVKSVRQNQATHATESESGAAGGMLNSSDLDVTNYLSKDVDLSRTEENNMHQTISHKQFMHEIYYKKSVTGMPFNITGSEKSDHRQMTMAESGRQNSFQTLSSETEELHAMENCNDNNLNNVETSTHDNHSLVTSVTGARTMPDIGNDNMVCNLPVNSISTNSSNLPNTINSSSNTSSGSRYESRLRARITDDLPVTECPKDFIEFISSHFNGKGGKNWEDLLSLYGWNYKQIVLFQNRDHPRGFFCSILKEPEFQQYTIGFLKDDLNNLPKKDTLRDVKAWIERYNESL